MDPANSKLTTSFSSQQLDSGIFKILTDIFNRGREIEGHLGRVAELGQGGCSKEALCRRLDCAMENENSSDAILATLFGSERKSFPIDLQSYIRLYWLDAVFESIQTMAYYEVGFLRLIQGFKYPLAKIVLYDDELIVNSEHPVRNFFTKASLIAIGLTNKSVGLEGQFYRAVENTLLQVRKLKGENIANICNVFNAASDKINHLNLLTDRFERRVCETKVGILRAAKGEEEVARFLNKAMVGKKMPPLVVDFLQGPWRHVMQITFIKYGCRSIEWAELSKLTITLIGTVVPVSDLDKKRLYRIIPRLPNQIKKYLGGLENEKINTQQFLDFLDDIHVRLLKGESIPVVEVESLLSRDPERVVRTTVSRRIKKKLNAIKVGQWFKYYSENGEVSRLRLAMKMEDIDQLLFVNIEGRKALSKSYEEVAYYLTANVLEVLDKKSFFEVACKNVYLALKEEFTEMLELERQVLDQQPVTDDYKSEAANDGAMEEKVEKTELEKEAELDAKVADVWRMRFKYVSENKKNHYVQKARIQIGALTIGAWVEWENENKETLRCKLAVKLRSTDKLIFVDRMGMKMLECSSDEFVTRLVANKIKILDQGEAFESTLERVVGGLREG